MTSDPHLRVAIRDDLPAIMALLADDAFSQGREDGAAAAADAAIVAAFDEIGRDANTDVYVLVAGERVLGTAQLTVIPGLSRRGMKRALVEAVRVASSERGHGLGRMLMDRLARIARERGCGLVQLSSDKRRQDAHRFYRGLGYAMSHDGFKLILT